MIDYSHKCVFCIPESIYSPSVRKQLPLFILRFTFSPPLWSTCLTKTPPLSSLRCKTDFLGLSQLVHHILSHGDWLRNEHKTQVSNWAPEEAGLLWFFGPERERMVDPEHICVERDMKSHGRQLEASNQALVNCSAESGCAWSAEATFGSFSYRRQWISF